nr:ribosomal protein S7 [Melastoma dodecandrum]
MRVRAIVYQTFHRLARTEGDVIKLMVDTVENIKPICEVEKVGVAGTIVDVPGIVAKDRQQTLAIRWILEAAFKRRINNRISLEKCSSAEILDAYRKRGIARKKRENRIFMDWLPPIEVLRISDGGKVRPHKELFLIQSDHSVRLTLFFCLNLHIESRSSSYSPPHSLSWRNP